MIIAPSIVEGNRTRLIFCSGSFFITLKDVSVVARFTLRQFGKLTILGKSKDKLTVLSEVEGSSYETSPMNWATTNPRHFGRAE